MAGLAVADAVCNGNSGDDMKEDSVHDMDVHDGTQDDIEVSMRV